MVYRVGLENRSRATDRGFESHPLRPDFQRVTKKARPGQVFIRNAPKCGFNGPKLDTFWTPAFHGLDPGHEKAAGA